MRLAILPPCDLDVFYLKWKLSDLLISASDKINLGDLKILK